MTKNQSAVFYTFVTSCWAFSAVLNFSNAEFLLASTNSLLAVLLAVQGYKINKTKKQEA